MLPNASAASSDGSIIATHTISSKEYQVTLEADSAGHIKGSRARFLAYYTPVTNAVGREVAELFNADAAIIVRVKGLWIIPTNSAVTGAAIQYEVNRISAVGTTGSTVITPRPLDTTSTALDADITARYGSTAGATLAYKYFDIYSFNEETNAGSILLAYQNQLPNLGDDGVAEIVLRQNEGLQVKQTAGATVGLTGALILFTVE